MKEAKENASTDNCYLIYDEAGYLTCSYNHKMGEDCLLKMSDEQYEKAFQQEAGNEGS